MANILLLCSLKQQMEIIHTISHLKESLRTLRRAGKTIGFVPTMGALHAGHAELVRLCYAENDVCVVSLFVNPTQFNNKEDLRRYPRTWEDDCVLLDKWVPACCSPFCRGNVSGARHPYFRLWVAR